MGALLRPFGGIVFITKKPQTFFKICGKAYEKRTPFSRCPFHSEYSIFCVPTLHINDYRNGNIILNAFIAEFIALGIKHHMAGKVPKSKDFYKVSLCSNTIVST